MTAIGELVVKIVPDARDFRRDTGREMRAAGKQAERAYQDGVDDARKGSKSKRVADAAARGTVEGKAQGKAHGKAAEDAKDQANKPDLAESARRGTVEGKVEGEAYAKAYREAAKRQRDAELAEDARAANASRVAAERARLANEAQANRTRAREYEALWDEIDSKEAERVRRRREREAEILEIARASNVAQVAAERARLANQAQANRTRAREYEALWDEIDARDAERERQRQARITSSNARLFRLQQEGLGAQPSYVDDAVAARAGQRAGQSFINGTDAAIARGSGRVTKRTNSMFAGLAGGLAFNAPMFRAVASTFGLMGGKAIYAGAAISTVGIAMKGIAVGAVGVGLGAAAFTALSAASLKVAGTYQQQAAAMNVLMGSTEKGTAMMKDLVNFSKSTPFELEGTIDAAKRIMAMGFAAEEVIPTLTRIGNAAAALGTGTEGLSRLSLVMGQIRSKGKLMTQDVNQLAEQGIPLWDILATKLGKTRGEVMDLTEQGLVPAETALEALNEYMDMKFSGTLQAQSETLLGTFENLKETFKLGFAQELQDDLPAIAAAFRDVFPALEGFSSRVADALGPALVGYLEGATPAFAQFLESFGRLAQDMMATWTPVMTELTTQLAVAFEAARPGLRALSDAFADLVGMFSTHLPAMANGFTIAAFGVQDLVTALESINADGILSLITGTQGLSGNLSSVSASLLGVKWLFLSLVEEISQRMEGLFRALPGGLGDSVADGMANARQGINNEMNKTKDEINRMTMSPKVRANVEDIESDLNRIAAKVESTQALIDLGINPDSIMSGDVNQLLKLAGLDNEVLLEAGFDPAQLQAQVSVLNGVINSMPPEIKAQLNFDRHKARSEVQQIGAEAALEWYQAVSSGEAPRLLVDAAEANANIDKTKNQILVYDNTTGTATLAADVDPAELGMAVVEGRVAKWDSTSGTATLLARDEASSTLADLGIKVGAYDRSSGTTTLFGDDSFAQRTISSALGAVGNFNRTTATATLTANNSAVFGAVDAALGKISEFSGRVFTSTIRMITGNAAGGPIGFASGGQVPVALSNGEFVLSPQAVNRIGVGNALALNAGRPIAPGPVRGPGTSTSDSIAGTLPSGAFVIKASSARKLGTGYLRSLAAGGMTSGSTSSTAGAGNSYSWTVNARTEPSEDTMLTLLRRADAIYGV